MSRTYHCSLCGEDWEYEHKDCDKGASRMERIEARLEALEAAQRGDHAREQKALKLMEALQAVDSVIMWMAENYAEGGGSSGPEMRSYREVKALVDDALKP
jgi:hypothetical protein